MNVVKLSTVIILCGEQVFNQWFKIIACYLPSAKFAEAADKMLTLFSIFDWRLCIFLYWQLRILIKDYSYSHRFHRKHWEKYLKSILQDNFLYLQTQAKDIAFHIAHCCCFGVVIGMSSAEEWSWLSGNTMPACAWLGKDGRTMTPAFPSTNQSCPHLFPQILVSMAPHS